eukprot:CAMPEP_0117682718 /NCGR_PEP_ID=MMETSP0804-20121206/19865_1 /TAXON_ID=1074897 /ORGANISM="Tetraselmis astigmatica, Strain CCMP880" /LENGTH=45 /DNA_ID= /DNA_START= /DNA_END= /DNA_ORIENTATION=
MTAIGTWGKLMFVFACAEGNIAGRQAGGQQPWAHLEAGHIDLKAL